MANLLLLLISCSIALFMAPVTSLKECRAFCGDYGPLIQFPFWLTDSWPDGCGRLPEFGLRCENRTGHDQPWLIINFPDIGDFVVKDINYTKKTISINDPDGCFPKRFLHNFSLPFYPFWSSTEGNWYTFLNCSTKVPLPENSRVDCLSNGNYTVLAAVFGSLCSSLSCYGIDMAACQTFPPTYVPYQGDIQYESGFRNDFNKDIVMYWTPPGCAACESRGGTCGVNTTSYESLGCLHSKGLSRSAKYGIILGVGITGLLGLIGLICFNSRRRHQTHQQLTRPSLEFSAIAGAQPALLSVGLDGPTIESYPKTMLGESKRLPKPGDTTCSICLCEYQPNNTLRTIPDCNHYFHVDCIDEWLRLNASCPLCRNSPEPSVHEMPPSSLSISTPTARPA